MSAKSRKRSADPATPQPTDPERRRKRSKIRGEATTASSASDKRKSTKVKPQARKTDVPNGESEDDVDRMDEGDAQQDALGNTLDNSSGKRTLYTWLLTVPDQIADFRIAAETALSSAVVAWGGKPKLQQADKESLMEGHGGLFVAPPASYKNKASFYRLGDLIRTHASAGLRSQTPSSASYFGLKYSNEAAQEAAVEALQGILLVEGKADSAVVVARFGETRDKVVWSVEVGQTATPDFKAAVRDLVLEARRQAAKKAVGGREVEIMSAEGDIPTMETKVEMIGATRTGRWLIRFQERMKWSSKHMIVNGVKRPLNCEGKRCIVCRVEGHSGWDCTTLPPGHTFMSSSTVFNA